MMKIELPSTPGKTSRRNSFSSRSSNNSKESKNPYSTSGLDKFSALLAELEEKKQRIYSKVNPDEISLLRFVYKDSDEFVPIVVKMKKKDDNIKQSPPRKQDSDNKFPLSLEYSSDTSLENKQGTSTQSAADNDNKENMKKMKRSLSLSLSSISWRDVFKLKLSNLRQPSCYLPAVIVLILLFLVFFGRSFAILCTSIGWYIVPTLQSSNNKASSKAAIRKKSIKKKDYLRIYSDNKMVATPSTAAAAANTVHNNNNKQASSNIKKHGHKKSW